MWVFFVARQAGASATPDGEEVVDEEEEEEEEAEEANGKRKKGGKGGGKGKKAKAPAKKSKTMESFPLVTGGELRAYQMKG
eukprot:1841708-Pyramimonas_sp.AAC.1